MTTLRSSYIGTLILSGILLVLSGCGDLAKLKSVKRVALVGFTVRKDIVKIDKDGNEKGPDLISITKTGKVKFGAMDETALRFYMDTLKKIQGTFKENGIQLITADTFKDNALFKKIKTSDADVESGISSIFERHYTPSPYAPTDRYKDTESIQALAEALGVDAVAFFDIYLVKSKSSQILVFSGESLGLQAKLYTIHKDGTVIIGHANTITVEADAKIDWTGMIMGNVADIFRISTQNKASFDQLQRRFLDKVSALLAKGKSS